MTASSGLLPGYQPAPGRHDAAVDERGEVREPWRELVARYAELGVDELERRRRLAGQALVAEGATTLFHDADQAPSRPAELDPVPVVIAEDDWAVLERGLAQRVRVLEAVLDDLYGHQRLVREGVIPPEAVLASPAWQRPAVGVRPLDRRLVVTATDLVLDAQGRWLALRDHTDAPSGWGYALMNRIVLTRLVPDAYRDLRVKRLGAWFSELRAALAGLAPPGRESPRTAVLTGGITHPSYADHGYAATYLGYHLAEGPDLAVHDGQVWLRSLDGLEPVDVLLRRVEDASADPLELGWGTPGRVLGPGGVPGLLHAVRRGGVGLANALGSGLAEQLFLLPYLAPACERLLGERLLLPSVPAHWLGDREARAEVVGALDRHVLHDLRAGGAGSVFGRLLTDAEAASWIARIEEEPQRYVAQAEVRLATSPVLARGQGLVPGPVALRAVTLATGDRHRTLPGGLGLVASAQRPLLALDHGPTKDVWVLAGSREQQLRLWSRPESAGLPQVDFRGSVSSRSAEALFWVGRNAERAESTARHAVAAVNRFEQSPELVEVAGGEWMAAALSALRAASGGRGTVEAPAPHAAIELLRSELADALGLRPGALADSLRHLAASAQGVREFLSGTTWRLLGQLGPDRDALSGLARTAHLFEVNDALDRVLVALLALAGLAQESIVRGPGWRFLDLGRRLERALEVVAVAEAALVPEPHRDVRQPLYELVLASHESLVAYRRRYRSDLALAPLCELLLADDTNPRSLAFQVDRLREDLASLPRRPERRQHEQLVDQVADRLLQADWDLVGEAALGRHAVLHQLLLDVRAPLLELSDRVVAVWFAHLGESHVLTGPV